jgi:hypothetical protein
MKVVICETRLKPRLVPVPSSKGDGSYYITIPSTMWNEAICDCKGFTYRGTCRHIDEIESSRCEYVREWKGEAEGTAGLCPNGHHLLIFELEPEFV